MRDTSKLTPWRRTDGTSASKKGTIVHVRLSTDELERLDAYSACRSDVIRAALAAFALTNPAN